MLNKTKNHTLVMGSGFAGLASACLVAKAGHKVILVEKNEDVGGRARRFTQEGFTYDMGPSWYWMPDIFEHFFAHFGKKPSDYFELVRLDPAFRIFFEEESIDVPSDPKDLRKLFEQLEPGSGEKLDKFLAEAKYKYEVSVKDILYKQPDGIKPYLDPSLMFKASKLHMLQSMRKHVTKYFKHPYLIQLLEFPVLFLGADASQTPALYSMMDYAGLVLGTWYPQGGFYEVIDAMKKLAIELGVEIQTSNKVTKLHTNHTYCHVAETARGTISADTFIIAGDYHHFDTQILPKEQQQYKEKYWDERVMAPSSLLFYIGYDGKIDNLVHHNLFFDTDFKAHSESIYETKDWPKDPLFYVCCPSKTDPSVAPEGKENLFILIPIASGIEETEELKTHYFNLVCERIQQKTGIDIRDGILYKRDYCLKDFQKDYNAFKGNAYGLANTLKQTAFLKPSMKHKKLKNLFYTGQLTVPGPGVPPALISGELAANYVIDYLKQ